MDQANASSLRRMQRMCNICFSVPLILIAFLEPFGQEAAR
jgi:hypothetical protein